MYKVGDEVSLKGEIKKVCESGVVVKAHYFGEAYIDKSNMDLIGKTYEQGLADAWELAKKIYDMKCDAIEEIFGVKGGFYDVIRNFTFEDCRDKIEAHEKEKEIKVGDEVRNNVTGNTFWIIAKSEENLIGYSSSPEFHDFPVQRIPKNFDVLVKTGRTTDAIDLLRQIGE